MKFEEFFPSKEPKNVTAEIARQQEAFRQWKEYLFLNDISIFEELSSIQKDFLQLLSQRYNETWKDDVLAKVTKEFYEFYEEEPAEGIRIQALDLDGLEEGNWQLLFEDAEEDHLVHVYFKGWKIDSVV